MRQKLLQEVEITYVRSSGPGGQNVNKVNSKAVLRFNPKASGQEGGALCAHYSQVTIILMLQKLAPRLTRDGDLLITSDRTRDQGKNREDCLDKLIAIIEAATFVPKLRAKTKPTKSSKRKRLDGKTQHSDKKTGRKKVSYQ